MNYLIWSYEHDAWWGPNHCGYTNDLEQAGRYSAVDTGEIVTRSIMMEELAVPEFIAVKSGKPKYHPYIG